MLKSLLANFYERDIRKLIEEVNLFKNEEDLWKTQGSVRNSSGNLVLHIIGGMNYLIGAILAHTGYVRDQDLEFIRKGVDRKELVAQLEQLIPLISNTLNKINLKEDYPIEFDGEIRSNNYVCIGAVIASFELSPRAGELSTSYFGVGLKWLNKNVLINELVRIFNSCCSLFCSGSNNYSAVNIPSGCGGIGL